MLEFSFKELKHFLPSRIVGDNFCIIFVGLCYHVQTQIIEGVATASGLPGQSHFSCFNLKQRASSSLPVPVANLLVLGPCNMCAT